MLLKTVTYLMKAVEFHTTGPSCTKKKQISAEPTVHRIMIKCKETSRLDIALRYDSFVILCASQTTSCDQDIRK